MSRFVANISSLIGLRAGVLLSAVILFMPPLTLLGMISPMAVKLNADSLQHVGRAAGNLYAVSTIDEGIEVLTGKPAGKMRKNYSFPKETVNWAVNRRLEQMIEQLREPNNSKSRRKK